MSNENENPNDNENVSEATMESVKESRDQMIEDLKLVIADAQNLAEEAKNASGAAIQEKARELKADLTDRMQKIRKTSSDLFAEGEEKVADIENLILAHPWRAVGIAAIVGAVAERLFCKK